MKRRVMALVALFLVVSLLPTVAGAATYSDTVNHWASSAIETWSARGVIQGNNGRFRPNAPITRGDLAIIINKILNLSVESSEKFYDLEQCTAAQRSAMLRLNAAGIMMGSNGYMRPRAYISREEAAVVLARLVRIDGSNGYSVRFSDNSEISSWAVAQVNEMRSRGYISGRSGNKFEPKANITRAEVVQILDGMFSNYYNKSGTYTTSSLGNVVVNAGGVILSQITIKGDLIITPGVGSGTTSLKDVLVEGDIYLMGGSLSLSGMTNVNTVYHQKMDTAVSKYTIAPPSSVEAIKMEANTAAFTLDGAVRTLTLNSSGKTVKFTNALIQSLTVNATDIILATDNNTSISSGILHNSIQMTGAGLFAELTANSGANGSSLERQPKKITVAGNTTVFMAGRAYENNSSSKKAYYSNDDDTDPTIADRQLNVSNLGTAGATISWGAASDNDTPANALRYALYYSESSSMSTVKDIEEHGKLMTAFATNKLTANAEKLESGQTYYFNVIVKDKADNKHCYSRLKLTIGNDTTKPSVGSISFSGVTETQVVVNWTESSDNVSSKSKLKYELYRSTTSNLTSVSACEKSGKPIMAAKENATSYTVTGLTKGSRYYFNVVVTDEAGNKNCYTQRYVVPQKDVTAPVVSSPQISVSEVTTAAATLSWSAASDNLTEKSNLLYSIYGSADDNIDSLSAIEQNGTLLMDSMEGTTSYRYTISGTTLRYFNVIVEDECGNRSCYTSTSALNFGTDNSAPTLPLSNITISKTTGTAIDLAWTAAYDTYGTAREKLQYAVYRIEVPVGSGIGVSNFDTVEKVEQYNGAWRLDYSTNRLTVSISGLTEGKTYLFNVIVRDEAGNKTAYKPLQVTMDGVAPAVSNATLLGSAQDDGATLNLSWSPATDTMTTQAALQYAVFATAGTRYTAVADVESKSISSLGSGYMANRLSYQVNGIPYSTQYYFYVIVRDEAGNKTLYNSYAYARTDSDAPILPSNSTVQANYFQDGATGLYTVNLSWASASDAVTGSANISYSLYFTNGSATYTTAEQVIAARMASVLLDGKGVSQISHGSRSAGTYSYYLIAKDEAGNMSLYQPLTLNIG